MNQIDVIGSIMSVSRALRRRTQSKKGLRGQHRLMRHLAITPGLTAANLAEKLDIRPASVSEVVTILEAEGHIRKEPVPSDRRKQGLYLTEKGHEILVENAESRQKEKAVIDTILTESERDQLIALCNKLAEGLQEKDDV